jgi:hypothetical protein
VCRAGGDRQAVVVMNYAEFLAQKAIVDVPTGFEPSKDVDRHKLFDFQRDVTGWNLRRGRSADFMDCGLGKSPIQLVTAQQVVEHTNKPYLILAPLCVAQQTVRQGEKFGVEIKLCQSQSDVVTGVNISNYEKLHRFSPQEFSGVGLDESSILKSYSGATRNLIIDSFKKTSFKHAYTATPAPNDYMELGNHAEFLGVMSRTEMLSTFFVHDGGDTSKWRLKKHAQKDFWRWLCSWAINIRKPSDLGYQDKGFELPKLNMIEHVVDSDQKALDGYLFALPASSLQERRQARKSSLTDRVDKAVEICAKNKEQWVYWCNLNSESEAIAKELNACEIRGSTSESEREQIAANFLSGEIKRVVTKPSIWGFGMNLQCCHNTALVGLSDSYEEFYQVIRRFWRFGQEKEVNAHIVISSLEGAVLANIHRKEADARRLADEMISSMSSISSAQIKGMTKDTLKYDAHHAMLLPEWIIT